MRIPLVGSYIDLIRDNYNYRYLWLSQVISLLGDWFNLIASASLVANLSGSGLAIGGLFLARLLPPFLLGPLAGVVADRFDRRKILIASDLLRTLVVLNFLFVQTEREVWLLYVLTVLQLSISAFFEPTRAALMPSIVARQDLITANALDGTTWSTMLALGAALGGLATALLGTAAAFLIDAATFIISAWFVSRICMPTRSNFCGVPTGHNMRHASRQMPNVAASKEAGSSNLDVLMPASQPESEEPGESQVGWGAFMAGLRYLWQRPSVLVIALVKASSSLAFGGIAVVEVAFAKEVFPIGDDGSATLGLIYLFVGLGTGLGPLVARHITGDHPIAMQWAILFTYVVMVIGYTVQGWAFTLTIFLIATFIRTIGTGINWVYSSSLLQMIVPSHFLGRVFAFDLAMMTLASATSTLWVGWAKDNLGLTPHQLALSLGSVPTVMIVGWLIFMAFELKRQQTCMS